MKSTRILYSPPSGCRRHSHSRSQYFIRSANTSPGLHLTAVTSAIPIYILYGKIFHSPWPPTIELCTGTLMMTYTHNTNIFSSPVVLKELFTLPPTSPFPVFAFYEPSQLINTTVQSHRNDFTLSLLCIKMIGDCVVSPRVINPCYTYI